MCHEIQMIQTEKSLDNSPETRIARVILEHAARINSEQDISALIGLHASLARDLVGGDRSSVWLIDEVHQELWTRVADGIKELRIPLNAGLVGASIASNRVIIANDLSKDERFHRTVDQTSGYRTESIICIPLRVANRTIGALQVLNKPGGFTYQDSELLGLMAVYAASAIQTERLRTEAEEARLLHRELDLARDVQIQLLPHEFPPVAGIEYFGFCRPARFVGGDYFDVLPLRDGSFAITLGDVSGKGIPAAVLMASIHTLLRNLISRNSKDLAVVVCELNRTIKQTLSDDRYSTLFCGVLDRERTELRYVNAGQIPPFILRRSGEIEVPAGTDTPVGMLENAQYRERKIGLNPQDTILCVSDGITDVKNTRYEFWDQTNIELILRSYIDRPLASLTKALVDAADRWAMGLGQHDDMTAVVVRIT